MGLKYLIGYLYFSWSVFCAGQISEHEALLRFSDHGVAFRNAMESDTIVPVGRNDFPLEADIKDACFGNRVEVSVSEFLKKTAHYEKELENATLIRTVLRENEKTLLENSRSQRGFVLEATREDLSKTASFIGMATARIRRSERYALALKRAYAKKAYAEIVTRKMTRKKFADYVREIDGEFFRATSAHHAIILEHLMP